MPQSFPMVQCGGPHLLKGWDSMLLHRFSLPECTDQERFIPIAVGPGSSQEHGGCCTLLHNGFQEQFLAGQNGPRLTTVYCFYC